MAPVKLVPVMVTGVPTGPELGERPDTVGEGCDPLLYVNWSAGTVALVPPPVVTSTSTVPVPAGEVAAHEVDEEQLTPVAAVVPKATVVDPGTKLVPVMVVAVPPPAGPLAFDSPVTVGVALYVNWSAGTLALVPPPVVTVTSTVAVPAGEVAAHEVDEEQLTPVAAVVPK
ncbi:MAG TPA: hypothetical protein VN768_06360, partial [Acidimicrobiales bacterium]|nr:hypothetical protein [Acidimicrobiales bacterium]